MPIRAGSQAYRDYSIVHSPNKTGGLNLPDANGEEGGFEYHTPYSELAFNKALNSAFASRDYKVSPEMQKIYVKHKKSEAKRKSKLDATV